jgi:hypothetical protein
LPAYTRPVLVERPLEFEQPSSFYNTKDTPIWFWQMYVPRITNYWMKITGASESAARGVPEWLRNGQGRWRLNDLEPSQMARKYIQSALEERPSTSDFGAAIKKQL